MSAWTFGDPVAGDQFKNADHVGDLVAFISPERKQISTSYGESDATVCRYAVVIDSPRSDTIGDVYDEAIIFGNLGRDAYGGGQAKVVLGRIAMGTAKAGQSAPYILNPADEAEKAKAAAWLDSNAAINAAGEVVIA